MAEAGAIWKGLNPQCLRDTRGGAAVEFAIIAPVLILLMSGILAYGGYFLTAHNVQQLANDAARAALAGINDDERKELAERTVAASLADQHQLRSEHTIVSVARNDMILSVRVTYDASDDLYWAFASLTPLPPPRIERTARIRLGGLW